MRANGTWKQTFGDVTVEITIGDGEAEYLATGDKRGGGTCEDVGDVLRLVAQALDSARF